MATTDLPNSKVPYALIHAESADEKLLSLDSDRISRLYREHGAILLRGFAIDTAVMRKFADQFCSGSCQNDAIGRAMIDKVNDIQSVNLGPGAFPLHPELSLVPWKPDVCFFACLCLSLFWRFRQFPCQEMLYPIRRRCSQVRV